MAFQGKNILAVIPARGGSKGITHKNLRTIAGHSLIAHVANCCKKLSILDGVILSSDDTEICNHAKELGIDVPFTRPTELATDDAKSIDVWIHAWKESEGYFKKTFDISILLEPTSPMRIASDIEKAIQLLLSSNSIDSVASVSKTPGHYTPHKTLKISESGTIVPFLEGGLKYSIRQHIPAYYHRNGICYAVKRESLLERNNLMEENCIPLVINRPVVNIDEEIDLRLAEVLLDNNGL